MPLPPWLKRVLTNMFMPEEAAFGYMFCEKCRIEEGHVKAVEIKGVRGQPSGVALRLRKDFLGTQGELLRLNDAEDSAARAKGVVGRAAFGRKLLNRAILVCAKGAVRSERGNAPTRRSEFGVDDLLARLVFGFTRRRLRPSWKAFGFWRSHRISEPLRHCYQDTSLSPSIISKWRRLFVSKMRS